MFKKILKYLVIWGAVLASTMELNGPTPWEVIGNTFSQPNVTMQIGKKQYEWYGSGDGNNDGKIDSLDLSGAQNDQMDLDGDGTPSTPDDIDLLAEFLNGNISYLPGHWNELKTPEERISWLEKMISINDAISPGIGKGWVCANYINQMTFEFFGLSNFEEFFNGSSVGYSDEYIARYNIPMDLFVTANTNNVPHSVGGVLVGRMISSDSISFNSLEFKDRYFVGYNNDDRVYPGNFNMHPDSLVTMHLRAYVTSKVTGQNIFDFTGPFIKWDLNNGEATLIWNDTTDLVLENPNIIKVHVGGIPDSLQVVLNGLPFNYNCSPENLFALGYDAIPDTTKENTVLPINLEYEDSDTIRYSPRAYDFTRKFRAWIYSGGVTKKDSIFQRILVDNITSVKNLEGVLVPKELKVYQNYPNPFNPSTTIKYEIPERGFVTLKVYDVLGNEVVTLINEEKPAGSFQVEFNSRGLIHQILPSGIYFYQLRAGNFTQTKKMILLK